MEIGVQIHVPAALTMGKDHTLPFECEVAWPQKGSATAWITEYSLAFIGICSPYFPVLRLVRIINIFQVPESRTKGSKVQAIDKYAIPVS
jgi:hypothetical protein